METQLAHTINQIIITSVSREFFKTQKKKY